LEDLIPETLRSSEAEEPEEPTNDFVEIRDMSDILLPYSGLISTVYQEQQQQKKRSKKLDVQLKIVRRKEGAERRSGNGVLNAY
jgi:hypothetical protein